MILSGVDIKSDITIPEKHLTNILEVDSNFPIVKLKVCSNIEELKRGEALVKVEENKYVKIYKNQNEIVIEEKRGSIMKIEKGRISYYDIDSIDLDNMFRTCFKPGIVLLSKYYDRTVLHGNAFIYNQAAVLIIAPSTYGKSTLSLALNQYQKCRLAADDVLVISEDGRTLYTGYETSWLRYDTVSAFGNVVANEITFKADEKCCYNSKKRNLQALNPLYPIKYVLFLRGEPENESKFQYECLDEKSFFLALVRNMSTLTSLNNQEYLRSLSTLKSMSKKVVGISVKFKKNFNILEEVTELITQMLDTMEKEGKKNESNYK